jgi:hypothetical protein
MSGLGIRVYTDEDVDPELAVQLRRRGYDVLSCNEAGNHNQGRDDDWQLRFATSQQRAILVFNNIDFMKRDQEWRVAGREHCGIVAALNTTALGELVRRTVLHLDRTSPETQFNTVLWLPRG